jgi:hypothetical protein
VNAKRNSSAKRRTDSVLKALCRAAKKAVELARLTGTPAYVLENGRIIDIAKRGGGKRRNLATSFGKKAR